MADGFFSERSKLADAYVRRARRIVRFFEAAGIETSLQRGK